jgi:hypothetical protein
LHDPFLLAVCIRFVGGDYSVSVEIAPDVEKLKSRSMFEERNRDHTHLGRGPGRSYAIEAKRLTEDILFLLVIDNLTAG